MDRFARPMFGDAVLDSGLRSVCLRASSSASSMARRQTPRALRTSPERVEIFAARKVMAAGLMMGESLSLLNSCKRVLMILLISSRE